MATDQDSLEAIRAKRREYKRRKRQEYRDAGLCTECGSETDGVHTRCHSCMIKNAAYAKKWRWRKIIKELTT